MNKDILLVDDDRDLRECVETLLESMGYRVLSAANGKEALGILDECQPCLILLDMRMPVMDGWEFCRVLDTRGPRPPPPIVVMTAAPDPAARAAEVRAQQWLGKPFECDDLEATVHRFCPIE